MRIFVKPGRIKYYLMRKRVKLSMIGFYQDFLRFDQDSLNNYWEKRLRAFTNMFRKTCISHF